MASGFLFVVTIVACLVVVALADGNTQGLLYNVTTACGKDESDDARIHLTSLMPFDVRAYCRGGVVTPFSTSDNFNYYLDVSYPDGGSRPCVFEQLKDAKLYIVEIVPSVSDSSDPVEFTVVPCPFFKNERKDITTLDVDDEAEYDGYKTVDLLNMKLRKKRQTSEETTENDLTSHGHPSTEESRSYKQKTLTLLTKEEQLLREQQEHASEANYPSTTTQTSNSVTDQHNVASHTTEKSLEDDSLMSPTNNGVSVSRSEGVIVDSPKELSHLIIDPSDNIDQDKLLSNTDSGEIDDITIDDDQINDPTNEIKGDEVDDDVNIDEVNGDVNGEDVNTGDVNGDDVNGDDVNGDDVNGEDVNTDDVNGEDVNTDDVNTDDVNTDDVNTDDVNTDDVNTDDVNTDDVNTDDVNADTSFNGVDSPETGDVEIAEGSDDNSAEDPHVTNGPDISDSSDVLKDQEETDISNQAEETDPSNGDASLLAHKINKNDIDSTFVINDKDQLPEQSSPANDAPLNQGQDGDSDQLNAGLFETKSNEVDVEEGRGSGLPSDSTMEDGSGELVESSINQGVLNSSDSSGIGEEDNRSTIKNEEGTGSVSGGLSVVTLEVVNILGTKMETNDLELGHKIRLRAVSDGQGHEAGIRPVTCYAMGSHANYAILRHGCGDGVVISQTKGFNTTGQQSTSPLFPVFKVGDDKVLSFHCNYTYCQDSCDGSSCNTLESEIKGTMTTLPDLEQGNGPTHQRPRKKRRQ